MVALLWSVSDGEGVRGEMWYFLWKMREIERRGR